jgi:hypothetical protein
MVYTHLRNPVGKGMPIDAVRREAISSLGRRPRRKMSRQTCAI